MSVADAVVVLFVDNLPSGHAWEKTSDNWNDLGKQGRKSTTNKCQAIKRAVRMVVMHMPSFPPESDRGFKSTLRKVTDEAVRNLRTSHQWSKDKTISIHTMAGDEETKNFEGAMKLPSDLPEVQRKAFDEKD